MLKRLTETFGVSGYEKPVRDLIYNQIKSYCTSVRTDNMGNLLAFKAAKVPGKNTKTVLLSAHMDEVGFIITNITNEGYLKFNTVGGIDAKTLISQRVTVNNIAGLISLKAVHLTTKEEREKPLKENSLYIDIGAKSKAYAEKYVSKGDYAAFDSAYIEFGDMIKAKALDDRVGCAIMCDILKSDWNVNLLCNFTVQEEVGLRGAKVAVFEQRPDFALVIEGTTCNDMTGTPENLMVTKSGQGVAISILDSASKADEAIIKMLTDAAERRNISYQFKASTAGGNDAGVIYTSNGGIKTASISVPCRYIHSPISVMNKNDYISCNQLVKAFLEDCGKESF